MKRTFKAHRTRFRSPLPRPRNEYNEFLRECSFKRILMTSPREKTSNCGLSLIGDLKASPHRVAFSLQACRRSIRSAKTLSVFAIHREKFANIREIAGNDVWTAGLIIAIMRLLSSVKYTTRKRVGRIMKIGDPRTAVKIACPP